MCVAADSAGRLRYMGTWIGERTGRHEEEESGGGLCHDCGRDIPDWLSNQEYLRPCEHGYGRCVGRVPLWLTNTVLNIPLFAAGFFFCGWRFIKRTLFATVMLSVSLYVLPEASYLGSDLFLSALFGGIISGVGTGLVFLTSCTTGGTDLLAALIQKRLKHYTLAQIMQVLDGLIVVAGASVFGIRTALYALIAIFCVAKVTDGLIEGLKFSKQAYIISEHYREIAEAIMEQMGRGVTSIKARGMYSDQEKRMLFCVVSKKEIVRLKEIVAEFDSSAFVIVSDAREVFGEGFIEY